MKPLLFATGNPHKLDEVRAILADAQMPFKLVGLADVGLSQLEEPKETGETFAENAYIKAQYYADASGLLTLADDSGLEVDALDGAPGVYSARYAGVEGERGTKDTANNAKLMKALLGIEVAQRSARFKAVISLARPSEEMPVAISEGTFEGRIILPEECDDPNAPERGRGANGFGYDPLLVLPEGGTSALLSPEVKNARSHRGQAVRAMLVHLQNIAT